MIIGTVSKLIDLDNLTEDDICIEDIATALSNICRWGGHIRTHYSVAAHCYHLAEYAFNHALGNPFYALMHDAAEAYVGDIPNPLKTEDHREIESRVWKVIASKFDLPLVMPDWVNEIDRRILTDEAAELAPHIVPLLKAPPLGIMIWPMTGTVRRLFLESFDRYRK